MPCRDYESDSYGNRDVEKYKEQADRLARIACKAMTALEAEGKEDFIMLQDEEVREWWTAHKIADEKAAKAKATAERKAQLRAEALAKLSIEEREALGIKVKVKGKA